MTSESTVRFSFNGDYSALGDDNVDYFAAIVYNTVIENHINTVSLTDFALSAGSYLKHHSACAQMFIRSAQMQYLAADMTVGGCHIN